MNENILSRDYYGMRRHLYPCINAIIKHGYSFWWFWLAHSSFNSYAPELVPMFYYCVNTQVQMFYFLIRVSIFIVEILFVNSANSN